MRRQQDDVGKNRKRELSLDGNCKWLLVIHQVGFNQLVLVAFGRNGSQDSITVPTDFFAVRRLREYGRCNDFRVGFRFRALVGWNLSRYFLRWCRPPLGPAGASMVIGVLQPGHFPVRPIALSGTLSVFPQLKHLTCSSLLMSNLHGRAGIVFWPQWFENKPIASEHFTTQSVASVRRTRRWKPVSNYRGDNHLPSLDCVEASN